MPPDVVTDRLFSYPVTDPSWQNDADGADTNAPQNTDSMVFDSPTALAGELRRIKSEVRGFSIDPAWVNYLGLDSAPSPDPPTKVDSSSFTLAGDWTAIAQVGRQVRITQSDGSTTSRASATISGVVLSGGITSVQLNDAAITETLLYVEFSALGSAALSLLDASSAPLLAAFPLMLQRIGTGVSAKFVVPPSGGGTGTSDATFGGDLDGFYPPMDPTIAKLQGVTLDSTPVTGDPVDQVLHYDVSTAKWISAALSSMLNTGFSGNETAGTVLLLNPIGPFKLKWIQTGLQTISPNGELDGTLGPFAWDTNNAFTQSPFWVMAFMQGPFALLSLAWDGADATTQATINYRNYSWITQPTPNTQPDATGTPITFGAFLFLLAIGP